MEFVQNGERTFRPIVLENTKREIKFLSEKSSAKKKAFFERRWEGVPPKNRQLVFKHSVFIAYNVSDENLQVFCCDRELQRVSSYTVMLHLGVADLIQLIFHAISGILVILQTTFHPWIEKVRFHLRFFLFSIWEQANGLRTQTTRYLQMPSATWRSVVCAFWQRSENLKGVIWLDLKAEALFACCVYGFLAIT